MGHDTGTNMMTGMIPVITREVIIGMMFMMNMSATNAAIVIMKGIPTFMRMNLNRKSIIPGVLLNTLVMEEYAV
jgi:hypothetical protein